MNTTPMTVPVSNTWMKKLTTVLRRLTGFNALLVRYHKSRLIAAGKCMKQFGTETSMPVWCSQRFQRHHQALKRLGFVIEKQFLLEHRRISDPDCYRAFCQLMCARFPDGYWTCAASGERVIVTAPPSQLPAWLQFLCEYDHVG